MIEEPMCNLGFLGAKDFYMYLVGIAVGYWFRGRRYTQTNKTKESKHDDTCANS